MGIEDSQLHKRRDKALADFAAANGFLAATVHLDLEKLAPAALRENPSALVDNLCLRFYGIEIPSKEKNPLVEFAASRFPLDDAAVASLIYLIMSTPRYQLC